MSDDDGMYGRSASDDEPGIDDEPQHTHTHAQTHTHTHTQFLDLTNGEGGERYVEAPDDRYDDADDNGIMEEQHYYDEDLSVPVDFDHEQQDHHAIPLPLPRVAGRNSNGANHATDGGATTNPSTRVVESGQEHTGRWTREEHESFLRALELYGKEWKKVAAKVKTRTVVQTRTHAQKYFQKLQKSTGEEVDMEVTMTAKKKKGKRAQQQRSASTTSAAHLLTHLPSIPSQSYASSKGGGAYPTHGFSAAASLSDLPPPPAYPPPTNSTMTSGAAVALGAYYSTNPAAATAETWGGPSSMTIVAPDPEAAMRRGAFPEPSPAASGKRKLAELAAAQMLAGVAASSNSPEQLSSLFEGDVTPPAHDMNEPIVPFQQRRVGGGLSLQIVNPENLGITYNETRKRSRGGEPSPTTPWDGQLEQLVSDTRLKEIATDCSDLMPLGSSGPHGNPFPHPICGPGSSYGRSPLHKAVCEMDMAAVHQELSDSIGAASLHRKDESGFYAIHSACALSLADTCNSNMAIEITRLLVSAGCDSSAADGKRNTPLHWAARSGDADVALFLLMRNCPPDAQNDDGDTALHWALRAGRRGIRVVQVLVENGTRPAILNNTFKRALDVAAEGFVDDKNYIRLDGDKKAGKNKVKAENKKRKAELIEEKREARSNLLLLSAQSRTLVLHHPECLEHIPKSESDWECPDRVVSIMRRLVPDDNTTETTGIFPHEVTVSTEFERAKLDFLSRVHSSDYLSFVNDLSKELSRRKKEENDDTETGTSSSVVPFTPMVQKTVMKDVTVKKESHSDTSFSSGSLRAARRAAGAVQHAVDCVLVGRHRNAFCVVRPPGHHAGVKGLLAGGESCGFCIFNNVAAGALHAISDERLMCQRCAIVDIDVHHGNGTEEIVKRCHDPGKLLFFSIHLYDHDRRKNGYSFYPGTGEEDDIAHNIINVPINPLWREQVQSPSSTNSVISTHNTRHKAKAKQKVADTQPSTDSVTNDDISEAGIFPGNDVPRDCDTESETTSAKGSSQESAKGRSSATPNMGRMAYRAAIQNRLLPSLRAFNPDLILISTGFDAAKGDVGNARHYLGGKQGVGLDLEPEDYAWTTRKILEIADICCQGRVVSVLEGGYGRSPVMTAPTGAPAALDKAFFSECAIRHLHAMIDPYDSEARFG